MPLGSVATVLVGRTATLELDLEELDPNVDTTLVTRVPTAFDDVELEATVELRTVVLVLVAALE